MRDSKRARRLLEAGASIGVMCALAAPAMAQTASPQTPDTSAQNPPPQTSDKKGGAQAVREVVVTARRAAIESAIQRKEHADTIVDSVVADEAGKLPDNSITEVLQRVVGVSITHFAAMNDPSHFSIEGSGVAVRGLSGVGSTLNGQEVFSANGGRGLSWEDVTPELMAGVDVYKANTAELLEGGIAGSIDLRTRMPFDEKGQVISGSLGASYGDMIQRGTPSGSVLYSNRWNTGIGKIGFLIDLSYSDLRQRADRLEIGNYYAQPYDSSQAYYSPGNNFNTAFVPGGFDYDTATFERKREGIYEATQWQPTDNLTFFQTLFSSSYRASNLDVSAFDMGGASIVPGPSSVFGANGQLLESDNLHYNGWSVLPCPNANGSCAYESDTVGFSRSFSQTTDLSEGFTWKVNDNLRIKSGVQYVYSTARSLNANAFGETTVDTFSLDTRGSLPKIGLSDPAQADPSTWFWYATMDHYEKHQGTEIAFHSDGDLWLTDTGFLRKVKFGVRYADRKEQDNLTPYNWQGLTPWWDYWGVPGALPGCNTTFVGPLHCFAATQNYAGVPINAASTYQAYKFNNFFDGQLANVPSIIIPSLGLLNKDQMGKLHQMFGAPGDTVTNVGYLPDGLTRSSTRTASVYARADFGLDDAFGMKMNGNFGLRFVHNENHSAGYVLQNPITTATFGASTCAGKYTPPNPNANPPTPGTCTITANGATPANGGRDSNILLPSFNIQFLPTPQVHVRFAASRGVTLPSFNNATASGSYGVSTPSGYQGTVNLADPANFDLSSAGYNPWWLSGTMGNPALKPQLSDNFDLSYEWYMPHNGLFHTGLFYKKIHDYIGSQRVAANIPPIYLGNGVTIGGQGAGEIGQAANLGDATVKGAEIGFTKFFDFLPGPFSGLGIDTNFTYIDSSAPGDQSYDMLGQPVHGLPINGLSRNVYNATLMYEKGPLSLRLAWNWRSKYLLTAESANGTSGQYSYAGCKAVPFNQAQGSCNYDPPVYAADYGQLDFGTTYRINQHLSLSIEGQNMLHAVTRTLQGAGAQQFPYSYFISDSRINGSIRFNF